MARKDDKLPSKAPGGKHHKRFELNVDEDTNPKFRPVMPKSDTTPDRLRERHAKKEDDEK